MIRFSRRQALRSSLGLTAASIMASSAEYPQSDSKVTSRPSSNDSGLRTHLMQTNSLFEMEALARDSMVKSTYDLVSGGAADEITLRWNREALDRIQLQPRVLVDVSKLDTRIKLFGHELPFPILLAPTGEHGFIHPDGELATVRGAGASAALSVISAASSFLFEDIARVATGPIWCQMFIKPDRALTRAFVERVEAAGCQALCVTVDDPITGVRDKIWRAQAESTNPRSANQTGMTSAKYVPPRDRYDSIRPDKVTWEDLDWLRSFARVPVLLKGVLNADDAERAVRAGASGLIVSNHGARQLDTVSATIDALPLIVERVAGRVPVLVDGGIRRGTDVLKALGIGASAVLIGRPYVYGLAVGGSDGVSHAINILRSELEVAMALTGRPTITSVDRTVLRS
jgi:4-hydroxymandelate oxidase